MQVKIKCSSLQCNFTRSRVLMHTSTQRGSVLRRLDSYILGVHIVVSLRPFCFIVSLRGNCNSELTNKIFISISSWLANLNLLRSLETLHFTYHASLHNRSFIQVSPFLAVYFSRKMALEQTVKDLQAQHAQF